MLKFFATFTLDTDTFPPTNKNGRDPRVPGLYLRERGRGKRPPSGRHGKTRNRVRRAFHFIGAWCILL